MEGVRRLPLTLAPAEPDACPRPSRARACWFWNPQPHAKFWHPKRRGGFRNADPHTKLDPSGNTLHGIFHSDLPGVEHFEGLGQGDDNPIYGVNDLWRSDTGQWIWGTTNTGNDSQYAYVGIEPEVARDWLEKNEHPEAVDRYFNKPRGGRPRKGEKAQVRIPQALLDRIDTDAERNNLDRSDMLAQLIALAYSADIHDIMKIREQLHI
ncbi:hypothetical protein ABT282_07600 [Streptomyces sp. NPDC000927]|uniref:hypothetical protein n=1 Tax=Streptomyces sp. NPDC000927 TaxID=3154371 RepID=UPI003329CA1B